MASRADRLNTAQRHQLQGELGEAQSIYEQLLREDPEDVDALHLMGTALAQSGKPELAQDMYRRALAIDEAQAAVHNNLAVACQELGQYDRAKEHFQRAVALDETYVDPIYNLANLYKQVDQPEAAFFSYMRVLELDANRVDAMINLGNLLFDRGEHQDAIESFKRALAASQDAKSTVRANINLGNTYRRLGDVDQATAAYDGALALGRNDGLAIKRGLTLPVVTESWDHIRETRRTYEERIDALMDQDLSVLDPGLETSTTSFFLAYHGLNDRDLQMKVAALHRKACPALDFTAAHCRDPKPPQGRIKVGFVSAYFRLHSVGRLMRGLIEHLDRDVFEVSVFTLPGQKDALARQIEAAADHATVLPNGLFEARDALAAAEQDILFYADLGMDIRTYFLAFGRLAPVQCVTWGHPDTTGIDTVDYFLSSELIEPEGADDQYSESLVRMPTLPTCYHEPAVAGIEKSELGLPGGRLYLCPQSTIKHHPDLDVMVGELLRHDEEGRVLLLEGSVREWTEQVSARMARTIPDVVNRVTVLPRVAPDRFTALLAASDVIIDAPHWSGGNTSYEAFAAGTPLVSHAGEFMRGRVTLGMLAMMGLEELTAETPEDCGRLAAELGTDDDWRHDIASQLAERRDVLFEEQAAVRSVEDALKTFARGIGMRH